MASTEGFSLPGLVNACPLVSKGKAKPKGLWSSKEGMVTFLAGVGIPASTGTANCYEVTKEKMQASNYMTGKFVLQLVNCRFLKHCFIFYLSVTFQDFVDLSSKSQSQNCFSTHSKTYKCHLFIEGGRAIR